MREKNYLSCIFTCLGVICSIQTLAWELKHQEHIKCKHSIEFVHHEVFYDVNLEPEHVMKKRSVDQPLRIHLQYDQSLAKLPLNEAKLINSTVLDAVRFWEDTLFVRATETPIRLQKRCSSSRVRFKNQRAYCSDGCAVVTSCGDTVIPPEHLDGCFYWNNRTGEFIAEQSAAPGISNADFILYVSAVQSPRCFMENTIAYAAHCQQERALDRPVAGYFSICPSSISKISQNVDGPEQLLSTMKHEILHALGFTSALYAFYRDSNGNPLTERNSLSNRPFHYNATLNLYQWSDHVVQPVTRVRWKLPRGSINKTVHMMVTPRVREEVQRHFNCASLEGAELENQGVEGTMLTHWEKRVFEDEAMTGIHSQPSYVSRITLAMMEDTGWYKVKYENAENYVWGKNWGCDFVKKSCYEWFDTKQKNNEDMYPYCTAVKAGQLRTGCTKQRDSLALCNLVQYPAPLPQEYQYFTSIKHFSADASHFGGSVPHADYCPYMQKFSWTQGGKVHRESSCWNPDNDINGELNYFGETYGPSTRCFNHKGLWEMINGGVRPQHSGSGCYRFSCSAEMGLSLIIGEHAYQCYKEGQVITVCHISQYLHGRIVCPACSEICPSEGVDCPQEREPPVEAVMTCMGSDINRLARLMPWLILNIEILKCYFCC